MDEQLQLLLSDEQIQLLLSTFKTHGYSDEEIIAFCNRLSEQIALWHILKTRTYETWGENAYGKGIYLRSWSRTYGLGDPVVQLFDMTLEDINAFVDMADCVDEFTRNRTEVEKQAFLRNTNNKKLLLLVSLHRMIRRTVDKIIDGEDFARIQNYMEASLKMEHEPRDVSRRIDEVVRARTDINLL